MCSFQLDFKRARGCNYGIPRLSQNKMRRLLHNNYDMNISNKTLNTMTDKKNVKHPERETRTKL